MPTSTYSPLADTSLGNVAETSRAPNASSPARLDRLPPAHREASRTLGARRERLARLSFVVPVSIGVALLFAPHVIHAAYPPSAEGAHVAVATDNSDATLAALATLDRGGTAADAAIAAALTLGVVSPTASGLGGGGFALVYTAKDKKVTAIDFREIAPQHVDAEAIATRTPKDFTSARGVAIGVPGEPAGLAELSRRYGRLSLAVDAAPAVHLADHGFYVGRHLADLIERVHSRVAASRELSATFLPGGAPVPYATLVRRPELADTIRAFGRDGAAPFYTGSIATRILDASHAAGGQLEAADLARYQVKERAPLTRTIDGKAVYTMPAPSAGGLMVLETLSIFGASPQSPLASAGFDSSLELHMVAEAMRGAIADRARHAGDPDIEPGVTAAFDAALDPAQIAARKARIDPSKTHTALEFQTREKGTTHMIVVDAAGNIVSLTTTVNAPFGAAVVAGDTGIVLNDQLDDFSTAKDVAGFGVVGLGPNRARPFARPVSSMTPTIVLENGEPILALGGSGGSRIATGVTQATICRLIFQLDPMACVSAPRIHVTGSQDMFIDPELAEDVQQALGARGEQVKVEPGGPAVQMIAWRRTAGRTTLLAASDPRKVGFAAAR